MKRRLFGTDGIRGKANEGAMTAEIALKLGRTMGYLLNRDQPQDRPRPRVVIGKDTRISGYMIEQALVSGLCSAGVDPYIAGPLPTPGVAFLTVSRRADAGFMISASHNPYEDNGIKIFAHDGYKLPDEREVEIEALMESEEVNTFRPTGDRIGQAFRISDAGGRYNVMAKSAFPRSLTLSGLKIVIDCAHGAAYKVAPEVLRELGAEVIAIGIQPNGTNINDQCGATYPQAVQIEVLHHQADLGISLDGDADRCILVDERGMVLDGDQILAVLARHLYQKGRLQQNRVVTTVMSNLGLESALNPLGIDVDRVQVGDRYVVARMRQEGLSLGGEQSGHTILHHYTTTGDGLVTALSMLSVMVGEKKKLSELAQEMTPFPQVLKSITVPHKPELATLERTQKLIAEIEDKLGQKGRVLVRYSGTQKMARVMLEGPDQNLIQGYVDEISACLLDEISSLEIP